VIDTVIEGFPLNVMYWATTDAGTQLTQEITSALEQPYAMRAATYF